MTDDREPWSADEDALLRELCVVQKLSNTRIAEQMSLKFSRRFTRSSVAGRIRRLGLHHAGGRTKGRPEGSTDRVRNIRAVKEIQSSISKINHRRLGNRSDRSRKVPEIAKAPDPSKVRPFLEADETHCMWPVDGGVCGMPRMAPISRARPIHYCAHHYLNGRQEVRPREPSDDRYVRRSQRSGRSR